MLWSLSGGRGEGEGGREEEGRGRWEGGMGKRGEEGGEGLYYSLFVVTIVSHNQ